MKAGSKVAIAALLAGVAMVASNATAQNAGAPVPNSSTALRLPEQITVYGNPLPSVVKASAIVNGEVITQTDIDQRLGMMAIASGNKIPAEQVETLRQQILRNLIDESLQIQAAEREEISISDADVNKTLARVAQGNKMTVEGLEQMLSSGGSSIRSMKHQIRGEMAWSRLLGKKVESQVSVGDDEVKAVIARLEASKGTEEFRVGEIYLPANSANQAQILQNAAQIVAQVRQGGSFVAYARQFSEASTAAVGGDLGWLRPEQLQNETLAGALRQMQPGQISEPIAIPGGYSILMMQDARKVLAADPRNAVLNLKQVSIKFPAGTSREAAEPVVSRFAAASQNVGGCGGAERLGNEFNAEVVQSDQVKMRDLPPALQQIMLPMQVGQATRPFGSVEDGVRVLVICGRDEVDPSLPTYDEVYSRLNEERVNLRARRYLRDLRRDAIIDFR